MAAILAFLAALSFGGADFLCGLASRRSTVPAVLLVSQAAGAVAALVAAPLLGGGLPAAADLAWGALAGSLGMVGLSALYAGIASGHAALVSPLSALLSALVPLVFSLATGERVTATGAAGMALCVPAILLLTLPERAAAEPRAAAEASSKGGAAESGLAEGRTGPGGAERGRPLLLALVAGLLLGGFYIAISRSSHDSGLWPLFGARMASMTLTSVLVLTGRLRFSFRRPDLGASLAGGLLDMSANAAFLVASRLGALGLASVLTSLYPAPTVVLAAVFFRERITWRKAAGLVLAIAGAALAGLR